MQYCILLIYILLFTYKTDIKYKILYSGHILAHNLIQVAHHQVIAVMQHRTPASLTELSTNIFSISLIFF